MSEEKRKGIGERYVAFLLRNRFKVLSIIVLLTTFFAYKTYHLKIATDFISFYPPKHPYIQLYNEYRHMFGSANVLLCSVEVKDGDIYNWDTINKIDRITQEMLTINGCNPSQLISLTHPRVKAVKIGTMGVYIEPVLGRGVTRDESGLKLIKNKVYTNEGIRGFYVANNDKSATIFAGFWEEGVDPEQLYERLMTIKQREEDGNHRIHYAGFPSLYAYIYSMVPQLYGVLGITLLVVGLLLFYYFRTLQGVALPALSALLSAVWGLGFASCLGYSLDPLILVVPLIITARAVSHSVQCMARYHEEYLRVGKKKKAIILGYGELFAPASLSIITDAVGLLLIAVATIPLMRHLGIFASFWIITIIVSVSTLIPIMLTFLKSPRRDILERKTQSRVYDVIAKVLLKPSLGKGRWAVLGVVVLVLVVGGNYARKLKVGDTEAGAAVLFSDHPYNKAFRFINENFVGATQMVLVVEGKEAGAIKNYDTLRLIEDFQRYMETEGGATGTITFNNLVKKVYRMFHEGHPKWEMLPKNPRYLGQIGHLIRQSAAKGELDQLVDYEWNNATITCFYNDFDNDVLKTCIGKAKEFIEQNPSDKVNFRLAGGLLGILAAVNEEVEYSYWVSIIVVFSAVFLLCVLTFRSFTAGMILIVPLALSQIISEVFMLFYGIDMNINSLPVAAIAVGIGIDYGIYLMARISEEYRLSKDYDTANRRALETTGKAIIFTATTLVAGVIFWMFVDVKFQAEMGLLLGLLMFLNMVNALIIIPSLIKIFRPKFLVS